MCSEWQEEGGLGNSAALQLQTPAFIKAAIQKQKLKITGWHVRNTEEQNMETQNGSTHEIITDKGSIPIRPLYPPPIHFTLKVCNIKCCFKPTDREWNL